MPHFDVEEVLEKLQEAYGSPGDTQVLIERMWILGAISLLTEAKEVISNYCKLLCEITGGAMSKPNYTIPAMLDCIENHYCDGCEYKEEKDD